MKKFLKNLLLQIKAGRVSNEEELRDVVDQASAKGFVEESEREMIHSVFELGNTVVRELMVPRTEMVWIDGSKNLRQGLSLALRSGYTRIPVIKDNLDNVIGIAYVKDLAKRVLEDHAREHTELVEDNLRDAHFVPENKIAADLLKEMQRNQIHMAIVVDEYGGTAGLITIEDILEEIVGEIADEYDDAEKPIEWLSDKTARVAAKLNVEDFAEILKIQIPDQSKEDVDSVGGLVAKSLGTVPIPGSTISIAGIKLIAERPIGRRHRISTFLVERLTEESQGVIEQ